MPAGSQQLISSEQIAKRVSELAKQISADYVDKELLVVGVLDNGFVFVSDLIREIGMPLKCWFIRADTRESVVNDIATREIFYAPELDVAGKHVLLCEVLVQSGQTTDFLMRSFSMRGASSVRLCVLLDKHVSRTIALQPDYYGFILNEQFVMGYGLGNPELGRNLPFITTAPPR